MSGYGTRVRGALLAAAIPLVGLAIAIGFGACAGESLGPGVGVNEPVLVPGVNAYLEVDRGTASEGARIVLTAKVRAVDVERTPTGFAVDLLYDSEKLKPLDAATLDDGVLRVVNLTAGSGVVKAAGAAPEGLKTDVLFEIEMTVLAARYTDGLELSVRELTVLEEDFSNVALDVVMAPEVVGLRR